MFQFNVLNKISDTAALYADRNAFCINDTYHTYNEFYNLIGSIRTLIKGEVHNKNLLGIVANDDVATYASIIAIWFEGMAYVPLHPKHPIERNLEIIDQAELAYVLNSGAEVEIGSARMLYTNQAGTLERNYEEVKVSDDSLAYILFTSGSTGKPKGVPITRGNLMGLVDAFVNEGITLTQHDRCLQSFDLTFDISVQCFLLPLLAGACVYTVPHNQIKFTYVYGLLDDCKLTFAVLAPSMIQHLKPYFDEIELHDLKYCLLSAEATPISLLKPWLACVPKAAIYNFYGPTEATIYCTAYKLNRSAALKAANGLLAIGRPLKGFYHVILDENGKILNRNSKGILHVCGQQVTRGYWKNPQKDQEVFTYIQFKGQSRRFYNTGDICLEDDIGDLLYFGRADHQIKIQGYRIELGEIEVHARTALQGQNVIAFTHDTIEGKKEIVLAIEANTYNKKEVLRILSGKLPSYMLPSKMFSVAQFPVNSSDKIDRKKIMAMMPKA